MKAEVEFKYGLKAKAHRKENNFMEQFTGIVVDNDDVREAVVLRIYGTSARNTACLWYNNGENWADGSGSAGGYGYHRPSAAVQEALERAGVTLSEDISGRGDSAIRDAVQALLEKLYPDARVKTVLKAHA